MSRPRRALDYPREAFALCALALALSLLGLAAVSHQRALESFGIVAGLPNPALDPRPASLAGVNVALEQYTDLAPVFDNLASLHWLRQTFPWDELEPTPDTFDWQRWDKIVAASDAGGHELIAVLQHAPAWTRAPGAPRSAPPTSPAEFGQFAGEFARRYGASIDVYQIWDEPNILLGWGDQPPSAAAYAGLLEAAYTAIHAADPTATVLAAGLAPTVETGPDNVSDLLYLQQLYNLGASAYFDAAAGKPYGFYTGPNDRLADPGVLNFSRFVLLRQVMERNGDAHKLLWASNFGWNTLASPWGQATPDQQSAYTQAAFQRASTEWPWAGPLAIENYQPAAPPEDPRWGFALVSQDGQASPLLHSRVVSVNGNFTAQHPSAQYTGDWEFSALGADIPIDYANASVTITFTGADLALRVRRGDYRGYLYVEIDGRPANLLPQDERGAYLVLTSPDLAPEVVRVPVASGLAGQRAAHTAVIRPERGWDQWALVGFSVGDANAWPKQREFSAIAVVLGLIALPSLLGAVFFGRRLGVWPARRQRLRDAWERLGATGQLVLTALVGGLLYLTSWLTWGNELVAVTRRFGDTVPLALTAVTAGLFYFSPSLVLALLSLAALFVLFYLRLDLALAFTALFIPFYLQYRLLWQRGFSMVEVCLLLALAAWLLHALQPALTGLAAHDRAHKQPLWSRLTLADWAVLAYFVVATLSTLAAVEKSVAIREYRLVILEPVAFYLVLRGVKLDRRGLWRVVDFLVLGAVAVAAIGLFEYATGADLILAEGGLARIRSVYGSPNNLALYLGRVLPLVVAIVVMGRHRARRIAYGAAALLLGAATALTFSRGALLLGLPAGLAVVVIGWRGRRALLFLGAALVAGLAALPLAARLPRFAGLLDLQSGTSFFRTRLWVSAWRMFLDHPLLGVGPDNFLYQYRSRYILPEAWQEPNLSHPHNIALDFLTRLGALGFVTGVGLQLAFWRQALANHHGLATLPAHPTDPDRSSLRALNLGLMGLMADMLAHGLVDHSFFLVDLALIFFIALALLSHIARLTATKPTAPAPAGSQTRPIPSAAE